MSRFTVDFDQETETTILIPLTKALKLTKAAVIRKALALLYIIMFSLKASLTDSITIKNDRTGKEITTFLGM